VNISKQTEKAFQILRDWDSKKYEYDQRFLFFYLNDILEIPENFTDDEGVLLGWLTDWHNEDIVIKDCDEKGHGLMTFSSKDGSYHALWVYPGLTTSGLSRFSPAITITSWFFNFYIFCTFCYLLLNHFHISGRTATQEK